MFVNTHAASNCSDGLERSESKVDFASSEYLHNTRFESSHCYCLQLHQFLGPESVESQSDVFISEQQPIRENKEMKKYLVINSGNLDTQVNVGWIQTDWLKTWHSFTGRAGYYIYWYSKTYLSNRSKMATNFGTKPELKKETNINKINV